MEQQGSVVEQMVRIVGEALGSASDTDVRVVFERGVQQALGAQAVRLRDPSFRRDLHDPAPSPPGRVLRVPTTQTRGGGTLEIVLPTESDRRSVDEETLAGLAHLAGLVADALNGDPQAVAPRTTAFRRRFRVVHFVHT